MSDLVITTENIGDIQEQHLGNSRYVFSVGYNDLVIGANRDFQVISDTNKLQQDILKILLTDRGSNTIYPAYGSTLSQQIGQKNIDSVKANVKNSIIEALTVLQIINKNNPNLNEQIKTINTISVDVVSSTEIDVAVSITTVGGITVNSSLIIS